MTVRNGERVKVSVPNVFDGVGGLQDGRVAINVGRRRPPQEGDAATIGDVPAVITGAQPITDMGVKGWWSFTYEVAQ